MTEEKRKIITLIEGMVSDYQKDYESMRGDHECELITKAKIIALNQVLDELKENKND